MAEILETYDWSRVSPDKVKARGANYPWDRWLNGAIWRLHSDTSPDLPAGQEPDFSGEASSLERVVRTTATRKTKDATEAGLPPVLVSVRVEDKDHLVVQRLTKRNGVRGVTNTPKRLLDQEAKRLARLAAGNGKPAKRAAAPKAAAAKAPAKDAAPKAAPAKATTAKRPVAKRTDKPVPAKRTVSKRVAAKA